VTQKHKNAQSNVYATRSDFCHIYVEQMNSLFLLSLLLTADPQKAEQCFLSGFQDSVSNHYVFKERVHSWARRSITLCAIRLLCPRPGEENESNEARFLQLIGNVPAELQASPDLARIVALNSFERFVFIMSILEKHSVQECSLLLGCFRRDVINAQRAAIGRLASVVIATEAQPAKDFISLAEVNSLASPLRFSTALYDTLNLSTVPNPKPYKFLQTLTLPDGTLVMIPVLCKQEYLSCAENHDEQSR
jgi:hypothetical protein